MASVWAELKRRNVFRIAVTYTAVAWVLIQVASVVYPAFDFPPWAMQASLIVTALGFLATVVLAWVYDLTPQGIKRTENISDPERITLPCSVRR